jgi:hypothetical protein
MFVQSMRRMSKISNKKGNPNWNIQGQTVGPHLMEILEDVARHFKKSPTSIATINDYDEYFICRCLYCYIACRLTNATLKQIGALINKDHSMVIHYRDKMNFWINKGDPKWIDSWFDWLEGTELWGKYEKIN